MAGGGTGRSLKITRAAVTAAGLGAIVGNGDSQAKRLLLRSNTTGFYTWLLKQKSGDTVYCVTPTSWDASHSTLQGDFTPGETFDVLTQVIMDCRTSSLSSVAFGGVNHQITFDGIHLRGTQAPGGLAALNWSGWVAFRNCYVETVFWLCAGAFGYGYAQNCQLDVTGLAGIFLQMSSGCITGGGLSCNADAIFHTHEGPVIQGSALLLNRCAASLHGAIPFGAYDSASPIRLTDGANALLGPHMLVGSGNTTTVIDVRTGCRFGFDFGQGQMLVSRAAGDPGTDMLLDGRGIGTLWDPATDTKIADGVIANFTSLRQVRYPSPSTPVGIISIMSGCGVSPTIAGEN